MATRSTMDFQEEILDSEEPVLVLFHAPWCPYCRSYLPVFRDAQDKGMRLAEVDIGDYDNPLWETYGIEVIPTMLLFQGGRVVARADGRYHIGLDRADLERMLKAAG